MTIRVPKDAKVGQIIQIGGATPGQKFGEVEVRAEKSWPPLDGATGQVLYGEVLRGDFRLRQQADSEQDYYVVPLDWS